VGEGLAARGRRFVAHQDGIVRHGGPHDVLHRSRVEHSGGGCCVESG
jgi:hypothetical protein